MLNDFQKAVAQMLDGRFLLVLLKAVGLTLALLIGVSLGFSWLVGVFLPEVITLPFIGEITFLGSLLSFAVLPLVLVLSIFLMIPVSALFLGFFLDNVADAVDRRHYPNLPKVAPIPLGVALGDALRFSVVFLLVNLLALVIYFMSTLLAPVIFWIVNGYLLSREYFHQVALRRMDPQDAAALRRTNRIEVSMAGIVMAVPLSIPILNLIIPVLGIATYTHMVERLRR